MLENRCDCAPQNQDLVDTVKNSLPNFDEIMDLSDFFKVMSDSTRLQLLISLQHSEMCVSDLANVLNMTKSAISHQLKALRISKLVKSRKDGKTVYYSLADGHIQNIISQGMEHIME